MLIAVIGATGTGKSALALDLADVLRGTGQPAEIVNADAMQLYRGMDIGTAKVPVGDRRGIPHHLLDTLEVTEEASVAAYQAAARSRIDEIEGRGAVPVLVGGSGLYLSAVLQDFTFPGTDPVVRARLESELAARGPAALHERLLPLDGAAAASIGPFNGRRLVRALEVIEITGQPFGAGLPSGWAREAPTVVIGLTAPREQLVPRLDERVRRMWRDGLLAEVESLLPLGLDSGITASRAIGYSQAIGQLRGELTEQEAIEQTQALTRRYARRQVGWFRRYDGVTWFEHDRPDLRSAAMAAVERGRASDTRP